MALPLEGAILLDETAFCIAASLEGEKLWMTGPERKWQVDTWVFVAFVAVITAIGVLFTLADIFKAG